MYIDYPLAPLVDLLEEWVNINSHSSNMAGISKLLLSLAPQFARLEPDEMQEIFFPNTKGLFLSKREKASLQIYLGGHLDTVFPPTHPFQKAERVDTSMLVGPGTADMKGGLVVLLKALEAFEKLPEAKLVGWKIFLNSDEEIGSPESTSFIRACVQKCKVACLFEPTLDTGALVSKRKGSSNFIAVSRGKKAHAGRNPKSGYNAIYPLSQMIAQLANLSSETIFLNVGKVSGGEAANIVPDYAECVFNLRTETDKEQQATEVTLFQLAQQYGIELIKKSSRPPKVFDTQTESLFYALKECAEQLSLTINWQESGGVCDGNTCSAAGVPTIDTLGVQGGNLHTEKEYVYVTSLPQKINLTTHFLRHIATSNIQLKGQV
jgi:glutamate carboxypeptidase